jgi:integrase
MALFAVNTGLRNREVCSLQWEWEVPVPELDTCVFVLPANRVKNGEDRLVVLNRVAKSVVDSRRGANPKYVFTFRDKAIGTMHNTAWQKARVRAGLASVRVHDLKHTFSRRLRAAGVSFEDRQDLLGHKSSRVTTHYSGPELQNLLEAANGVCEDDSRKIPALVVLKEKAAAARTATA